VTDEPTARGGIEGFPTGLTWQQHHRVARVVASASTDAMDCALLLAALGIHPADGLRVSSSMTPIADLAHAQQLKSNRNLSDADGGIRRSGGAHDGPETDEFRSPHSTPVNGHISTELRCEPCHLSATYSPCSARHRETTVGLAGECLSRYTRWPDAHVDGLGR
jgi:hypothetical protein